MKALHLFLIQKGSTIVDRTKRCCFGTVVSPLGGIISLYYCVCVDVLAITLGLHRRSSENNEVCPTIFRHCQTIVPLESVGVQNNFYPVARCIA
ncbi:hypothetical protein ElyMa_001469400 [Elysia marginata]|uniref:Uncharacterized protein n=1 Tax=Elysia marginata TaxID=1093978 RepID=A0AAV4J6V6_9GAST|nr:hypothetical protein ElyMa_001469400 [Elysia marginata]